MDEKVVIDFDRASSIDLAESNESKSILVSLPCSTNISSLNYLFISYRPVNKNKKKIEIMMSFVYDDVFFLIW